MNALLHSMLQLSSHGFAQISPAAAGLLIASVWRGAALTLAVGLLLKLVPRLSAAVRSAIWLCVLAIVVALPVISWALPMSHNTAVAPASLFHADLRWSYGLTIAWLAFTFLRLLQLAASAWQLRQLARRSTPMEAGSRVLRIFGTSHRRVELCASSEVDRPSVAGFFRPRILIPTELLADLRPSELEQIVLHELEHLRRYDDWTNLLQKLSVAFFPLHPVVMWLDRRLCFERELACDDGVLRATQSRKSYAACLATLAEHSLVRRGVSLALGLIGAAGVWRPRSEVAKRVLRILAKPEKTVGRIQTRIAAGAVFAGVLGVAAALAHAPRLITFTPVAPVATGAEASMMNAARNDTHVTHALLTSTASLPPHAVFAKAVMTSNGSQPFATNAAGRKPLHRTAIRRVSVHAAQVVPQPQPLFRLAAWQQEDMPAPHFTLAMQQDSQFTYAAVPVRGGWLIVQL